MSKLHKAFKWAFWPTVFGMVWALLAIGIYDRFAHEDSSQIFYSAKVDATCIIASVHGKQVMWCFDGKRSAEAGGEL